MRNIGDGLFDGVSVEGGIEVGGVIVGLDSEGGFEEGEVFANGSPGVQELTHNSCLLRLFFEYCYLIELSQCQSALMGRM